MKEDQREKVLKRLRKKLDDNPGSRACGIDLLCTQCLFDPMAIGSGGRRSQIESCLNTSCGVYAFRPVTTGSHEDDLEHEEL